MHLIDAAGHVNNQFVHEDPTTNRPPTEIDADWLNAVQNEIANVIKGLGFPLDKSDSSQLLKVISGCYAVSEKLEFRVSKLEAPSGRVIFTSVGVSTFVVPEIVRDGKRRLWVRGVAGGGSGAAANGGNRASGGSGGGGFDVLIDLTGVDTVTCTVGAGGAGAAAGAAGRNGTATSFGTYASASGGFGGLLDGNAPSGGLSSIAAGIGIAIQGGASGGAVSIPSGGILGGIGGGSMLGLPGAGVNSGGAATGYGSGSGGTSGAPAPSAAGRDGVLILEW